MVRRLALTASGRRQVIAVSVGIPRYNARAQAWLCKVHMPLVMGDPIDVRGGDALAAVLAGVRLLKDLVKKHKEIGWAFEWLQPGDDGGF